MRMNNDEQVDAIISDVLNDIRCAEVQAHDGPFFPEMGITTHSLLAYAESCRIQLATITTLRSDGSRLVKAFIAGQV